MTRRGARGWIVAIGALLACAGCGFKGPLYLPGRNATVVTHPAPPAPSASQGQAPATKKKKSKTPPNSQPPLH